MSGGACPDDRLVGERRGDLSADEARALRAHLETCAFCRMSAVVGQAVGPLPAIDDEDEAMAARLVARQLDHETVVAAPRILSLPFRARRWRGSRTMAVAASLLLVASAASAAYWTVHRNTVRRVAIERAALTPSPTKMKTKTASGPTQTAPPAPVTLPAPPEALAIPMVQSAPPPVRATAVPTRATLASLDPEALLRDANEARRARHTDEAVRGYRLLQSRFPTSREAVLSHLSLGNLLLAQGAPADALAQFAAYLRGDSAELAEEALLGEARALAVLGRPDEERAVWLTLESRFPTSEYLWRARQRLRELDRGATP